MLTKRGKSAEDWHRSMCHAAYSTLARSPGMVNGLNITAKEFGESHRLNQSCKCFICAHAMIRRNKKTSAVTHIVSERVLVGSKNTKCHDHGFTVPEEGDEVEALTDEMAEARNEKFILSTLSIDLSGRLPKSIGGNEYYMLFRHNQTKKRFIRFLKSKSAAFTTLKEVLMMINVQKPELRIQAIRSDPGGEFISQEMNLYLRSAGIQHQLTAPGEPWQNGGLERQNQSVKDKIRACLYGGRMSIGFWCEAAKHAVDTLDILPVAGMDKTPHEMWYGCKPSWKHQHPFGVQGYLYDRDHQGLEMRGKVCRYLSTNTTPNGTLISYRVWVPASHRVLTAFNCEFMSNVFTSIVVERNDGEDAAFADELNPSVLNVFDFLPENNVQFFPRAAREETLAAPLQASTGGQEITLRPVETFAPLRPHDVHEEHYDANRDHGATDASEEYWNEEYPGQSKIFARLDALLNTPTANLCRLSQDMFAMYVHDDHTAVSKTSDSCLAVGIGGESHLRADPMNHEEAMALDDADLWRQAELKEMDGLELGGVYKVVPRPPNVNVIDVRMVYTYKWRKDLSIDKRKCRLVCRGFKQRYGVDFEEVFSPVLRTPALRILLYLAAVNDCSVVKHMDITMAFTKGPLDETIYVQPPKFWQDTQQEGKRNHIWLLQRALYGLKQGSRAWNKEWHKLLVSLGFTRCWSEHAVYIKTDPKDKSKWLCIGVFVDDEIVIGTCITMYNVFEQEVINKWGKDQLTVNELDVYIGCIITRNRAERTISMSHESYIVKNIIGQFNLDTNVSPVSTPMSSSCNLMPSPDPMPADNSEFMSDKPFRGLLGAIMHTANMCRPDVSLAITTVSRFAHRPGPPHWYALLRIARYLYSTRKLALTFGGLNCSPRLDVNAFVDANWATPRSTSGGALFLGPVGSGAVAYMSKGQNVVTLSTLDSEYVSASLFSREVVWTRYFTSELGQAQQGPCIIRSDNLACIQLSNNPEHVSRAKHIDVKFHYIRDKVEDHSIKLQYVNTNNNVADIFTKPLELNKFVKFREMLGIR